MKNFAECKIKNVYAVKSYKHKNALNIDAFKQDVKHSQGGFIVEQGSDMVDGEEKEYLITKIYF